MAAEIRFVVFTSRAEAEYHGHEAVIRMNNIPALPPHTRLALGQRMAQVGQEMAANARRDLEIQKEVSGKGFAR